jgi:UDP-N-acetylmuramoylalanine--D-glutamate ligase
VARLHERGVRGVVLIGESRAALRALVNGGTRVCEGDSLEEGVRRATALAAPGSTVLFSPGCASFDMFRNFEERGLAFKAAVGRLARDAGRP